MLLACAKFEALPPRAFLLFFLPRCADALHGQLQLEDGVHAVGTHHRDYVEPFARLRPQRLRRIQAAPVDQGCRLLLNADICFCSRFPFTRLSTYDGLNGGRRRGVRGSEVGGAG